MRKALADWADGMARSGFVVMGVAVGAMLTGRENIAPFDVAIAGGVVLAVAGLAWLALRGFKGGET